MDDVLRRPRLGHGSCGMMPREKLHILRDVLPSHERAQMSVGSPVSVSVPAMTPIPKSTFVVGGPHHLFQRTSKIMRLHQPGGL